MPHMQRLTWSGIALHGGLLPGYPASHGCVRLPFAFATHLFDLTKLGMRVIVARSDVASAFIEHPALFQPKPDAREAAAARVAEAPSCADAAQPRHLKAGGRLFAIGDAGDGCYRLGQGLLKAQEQAEHEAYSWNSDRVDQCNSQDCPLALHVLAYNLTRAMKIMGIQPCPAP